MTYNEENGTVIYRSRMHAKTKRNFEIFSAEDFLPAMAPPEPVIQDYFIEPILEDCQYYDLPAVSATQSLQAGEAVAC